MGDQFNNIIDNLQWAFWRILEFPLFILVGVLIIAFLLMWRSLKYIKGAELESRGLSILLISFFLLLVALIVDHKIADALNQVKKAKSESLFMERADLGWI